MKIYIDSECKCHTSNTNNTFREFDIPFFDGKCNTFIEGYRYCPKGESYIRWDGVEFYGECITPWKPYEELDAAQHKYERQQLNELKNIQEELNTSYQDGINSI